MRAKTADSTTKDLLPWPVVTNKLLIDYPNIRCTLTVFIGKSSSVGQRYAERLEIRGAHNIVIVTWLVPLWCVSWNADYSSKNGVGERADKRQCGRLDGRKCLRFLKKAFKKSHR